MAGTLYIVSTPIGNLEDMTFRALRILQEVSIIAAEDTRRTKKLCTYYNVRTPLTSYHDFNKEEKTPVLIHRLEQHEDIALVSDAGTPLISDPGFFLVRASIAQGLTVTPVPGASSILAALTGSGLPPDTFAFQGFLPKKVRARTQALERLVHEPRTLILFETAYRLRSTLEAIDQLFGERNVVIARELTKMNETFTRGTAKQILEENFSNRVKGEVTIVIEGLRTKTRA